MQGFELMLKAMGVDPQKMAEDAMAKFGPELERFKGTVVETIKAEVIEPMAVKFGEHVQTILDARDQAIMTKLASLDEAIKSINPGYVPAEVVDLSKVTNPNTPEGGAVDMAALDQERLANQGSVQEQEAMPVGQVDVASLETGNGQGDQVQEGQAANQVQEG